MNNLKSLDSHLTEIQERALSKLSSDDQMTLERTSDLIRHLVSELQTYHIELENQHEELLHAQLELTESNRMVSDLYDNAPVGYATLDFKGNIINANRTLLNMLNVTDKDLSDESLWSYVAKLDSDKLHSHFNNIKRSPNGASCELRLVRDLPISIGKTSPGSKALENSSNHEKSCNPDQELWVQLDSIPVFSSEEPTTEVRTAFIDITDRKKAEQSLKDHQMEQQKLLKKFAYNASHDFLTGLVNRSEFESRLNSLLIKTKTQNTSQTHALCYLDLDQFKVVNDTCGHASGDELLRQLSLKIAEGIRQRDTFARLGGDEFAILIENCSIEDAANLAESIKNIVEDFQFHWEQKPFRVSASIGLVGISCDSKDTSELLKFADAACYLAKERGRNRIHVYKETDYQIRRRLGEMSWVNKIRSALDEDRFELYGQVITPVNESATGKKHFELLVRMLDDKNELILPGAFLGAAENYDLITNIDSWVVKSAFEYFTSHPKCVDQIELCNINISGASVTGSSFLKFLIEQLELGVIAPEMLCFEITETATISNLSKARNFISTLKKMGCKFALDDFGTGLSSFAYLRNIPVDFIKIDGMFVRHIATNDVDHETLKAIHEIAQVMGKKTIAECVENRATLNALSEIGIDFAQGTFIGNAKPYLDLFKS